MLGRFVCGKCVQGILNSLSGGNAASGDVLTIVLGDFVMVKYIFIYGLDLNPAWESSKMPFNYVNQIIFS